MTLFERYGRHVECTITGQLLLPLAQAIVTRTEDAISLMREQAGQAARTCASEPSATSSVLLTPVLGVPLAVSHGDRRPREKDDAQLEEAVVSGELDCAVMTPWGSSRAVTQHLMTEEILLVVPQGHRLARLSTVPSPLLAERVDLAAAGDHERGQRHRRRPPARGLRAPVLVSRQLPRADQGAGAEGLGWRRCPGCSSRPRPMDGLVAIPFEKVTAIST